MRAVFNHKEREAKGIYSFWFSPEKPLNYLAGQFSELYLPHDNPDSRGTRRWFTLSSSPTEGPPVSITTKILPERRSSFMQALTELQPGSTLTLSEPLGDFVLPKEPTIPLVFIAAGIGITPFRSMVKFLLDTNERRDIYLIRCARSLDELAFAPLFARYDMPFTRIITEPPTGWHGESGKLDAKRIIHLAGNLQEKLTYLAGPEPMVQSLRSGLEKHGVPGHLIISDAFLGYTNI